MDGGRGIHRKRVPAFKMVEQSTNQIQLKIMTLHPITGFPNTKESDNRNRSDIVLSNRISRTNIKKYVGQSANISAEIYNTITIKF